MRVVRFVLFLFLFSSANKIDAENLARFNTDTTQVYYLKTVNDSEYLGTLVSIEKMMVVFDDFTRGNVSFDFSAIKQISKITSSTKVLIKTIIGTELTGTVYEINKNYISIKAPDVGILTLVYSNIKQLYFETDIKSMSASSNNSTKNDRYKEILAEEVIETSAEYYFVGSSAFALPQKSANYKTIFGLVHTVDFYGNKNLQIGVGSYFIFGLYASAKYSYRITDKVRGSIFLNGGGLIDYYKNPFLGFAVSNITIGNKYKNITAGVGYYYLTGRQYSKFPAFQFAWLYNITSKKNIALMFESYIYPYRKRLYYPSLGKHVYTDAGYYSYVACFGFRSTFRRTTLNFGGISSDFLYRNKIYFPLPFISFSWKI